MDLKALFIQTIEQTVFPAIDKWVADWHTPFEIDDTFWAGIKQAIRKILEDPVTQVTAVANGTFRMAASDPCLNGVGALDLKDLLKTFVATTVFPAIDQAVKGWHTPFEIDDIAWGLLRARIAELLNLVTFVKVGGEWTVATPAQGAQA